MTASQHQFDPNIYHGTISVACLVLGQLLPYGRDRLEIRR